MQSPAWEGDWPLSQLFGVNPSGYVQFGLAGHNGIDIAMPQGTPLLAVCNGVVLECRNDTKGYGQYIKIQSEDGQHFMYAHLAEWATEEGATIASGTVIGLSGTTGNSSGPHLHFGWRMLDAPFYRGWPFNGYVDPRQLLDRLQGGLWPLK